MIIKTINSTYRITPLHTNFEVEKIAESTSNPNGIVVGWKHICKSLIIHMHGHACFDNIMTSKVIEVYNESPTTTPNK